MYKNHTNEFLMIKSCSHIVILVKSVWNYSTAIFHREAMIQKMRTWAENVIFRHHIQNHPCIQRRIFKSRYEISSCLSYAQLLWIINDVEYSYQRHVSLFFSFLVFAVRSIAYRSDNWIQLSSRDEMVFSGVGQIAVRNNPFWVFALVVVTLPTKILLIMHLFTNIPSKLNNNNMSNVMQVINISCFSYNRFRYPRTSRNIIQNEDEIENFHFRRRPTSFLCSSDPKRFTWMAAEKEAANADGSRYATCFFTIFCYVVKWLLKFSAYSCTIILLWP